MTAEVLRLSVPVVPRAEAVVWSVLITSLSAVVLAVAVMSSVGEM